MALTDNILAYWNLNDNGSGGVSLVDSTGNGYTLTNYGDVTLGTGIIAGDAVFDGTNHLYNLSFSTPTSISVSFWIKWDGTDPSDAGIILPISQWSGAHGNAWIIQINSDGSLLFGVNNNVVINNFSNLPVNSFAFICATYNEATGVCSLTLNSLTTSESISPQPISPISTILFSGYIDSETQYNFSGQIDEVGTWSRALSLGEVGNLYNNGAGNTYPFVSILYYNNAESDGDWGNILNWWQDSGFTIQATALPTSAKTVNLYSEVTQNTQGSNQCFCGSATFWSANFGAGLTLQSTGVVNMQGTSVFSGTTTDGVSMHDSSQLSVASVVDGNTVMRDSSRAFGSILGNATIYYDGGNGQYPIGGTVVGSVTYLGWPAISPQWFNDSAIAGGNDGDFANTDNWWTDNTYTTRPVNTVGVQELPDASTNVFIAPDIGIYANTGDAILVNSITANNGYISNITLTVSNGIVFSGNGNYGTSNSVIYADVTFSETAYNDHSAIHGNANYTSSASLVASFNHNSLGKLTAGASYGSNTMTVNIAGGGGGGGMISRLLNLPWFINI